MKILQTVSIYQISELQRDLLMLLVEMSIEGGLESFHQGLRGRGRKS